MEEDGQRAPSAHCIRYHGEPAPQTSSQSSGLHSCEDASRSSSCQRRRGMTGERNGCDGGPRSAKRQRMSPSPIQQSDPRNINEDKVDIPDQQQEEEVQGLDLPKGPPSAKRWVIGPKGPPSAKRWVIGPLLQSFKSKMASFTEIVMSPVRIFTCPDSPSAQLTDSALQQHGVVQRLAFDSDSSNANAEDNDKISPKSSESQRDISGSSGEESQFALTNKSGAVCLDAPSPETPHPDSSCSHSLILDAGVSGENITLAMSTVTSPRKGTSNLQERVQDSEGFSLVKAAKISDALCAQANLDDLMKPVECVCKGSVAEISASCEFLEREKVGQVSRSRTRRKRDARCRLPANDTSDITKVAKVSSGTTLTAGSDGTVTGAIAPASVVASGIVSARATGTGRAMRKNNGAVLCAEMGSEDLDAESRTVEPIMPPGPLASPASPQMTAERAEESSKASSDLGRIKSLRRGNIRQAKHKLEASNPMSGAARLEPASKKQSLRSKREGPAGARNAGRVFKEQRVSVSLTLQVGPAAQGHGNPVLPPAHAGSAHRCQAENLPRSCRVTRRRAKMGADVDTSPHASSTPELSENMPLGSEHGRDPTTPKSSSDLSKRVDVMEDWGGDQDEMVEEDIPVAPLSGSAPSRLLRSLSCPDIPSLQDGDHAPLAPPHDTFLPSPYRRSSPVPPHVPADCLYKRYRRHTVCTVEMEREIAPLCLRKEVHPVGRARTSVRLNSCSSPLALASCFLSSPLAFLSSKSRPGWHEACGPGAGSSPPPVSPQPPSHCPLKPKLPVLPAPRGPSTPERTCVSLSPPCCVLEPISVEVHCDGVRDGRDVVDQSVLGTEDPSSAVSEERNLSHVAIKTDGRKSQNSKVSSVRIRKTLPKPQYNLTPMGLPRAVRIKKKVFSVEEIYTNKNFSQPPEGRLETIFEVPLSRRDGSQSLIGQKRMKRFVEFPELGVTRKPRKPLIGGAGVGPFPRKVVGSSGSGRPRRGGWASSREGGAVGLQELEALLCSRLNELDSWMALEQMLY